MVINRSFSQFSQEIIIIHLKPVKNLSPVFKQKIRFTKTFSI